MNIVGNMAGCYSPIGKTFVITDENGVELTGVVTENVVVFDANPKTDIREGKVAATSDGIVTGSAIIPNYETTSGKKIIPVGSKFTITLSTHDAYDYDDFQCIICPFNSSLTNSVASERVVIEDNIYNSNSTEVVASITKDAENKAIQFNIDNTTNIIYILRYTTYKKIY